MSRPYVFVHAMPSIFRRERTLDIKAWSHGLTVGDVVPKEFQGLRLACMVNGVSECEMSRVLSPGEHVTFVPAPADFGATATVAFLGFKVFETSALLATAAVFAGNLAISLVIGRLLAPPPKARNNSEALESPTYSFGGVRGTRNEGAARPVLFGRLRMGGVVIGEYIDFDVFQDSTIYSGLVLLGHGPITSVGGKASDTAKGAPLTGNNLPALMEIDGNAAKNFDAVEAQVRLGSIEQEVMDGFESTPTVNGGIEFSLLQNETSNDPPNTSKILTPLNYSVKATSDAQFNVFGVSYSMVAGTLATRATLEIQFPSGLGYINNSGVLKSHEVHFAVRYIELDGSGAAITSGGPESDGYVRLAPSQIVSARKTGAFVASIPVKLFDPQTYTHGSVGEQLHLGATGTAIKTSAANPWTPGENLQGLTMSFWMGSPYVDTDTYSAPFTLFSWTDANFRGWRIVVKQTIGGYYLDVEAGDTVSGFLVGFFGEGSGAFWLTSITTGNAVPQGQRHFVYTVGFDTEFGQYRHRMYSEGVLRLQFYTATKIIKAPGAGGAISFFGQSSAPGRMWDEVKIIADEWTASQVQADYNGGFGYHGNGTGDLPGLVSGWHFNAASATSYGPYTNDLTYAGSAATTTGSLGKVQTGGGGTAKAARYRIEIVRNSLDGTVEKVFDDCELIGVTTFEDDQLTYPNSALIAYRLPASEQLSGVTPDATFVAKGVKCPVYDGANVVEQYSANVAWVLLKYYTDKVWGLGDEYDLGDMDLDKFKEWADYCDHLIDSNGDRLTVDPSGTEVTNFYYDAAFSAAGITYTGPAIQIKGSSFAGGLTFEAYRKLGKPDVGDYIALEGLPNPDTGTYPTGLNCVDGPLSFTAGVDESIGGGLRVAGVVFIGTNSYGLWVEWPDDSNRPFANGTDMSTFATPTGTVRMQERRFEFNGVFDAPKPSWDQALSIAMVGRAVPVRVGNRVTVKYEYPRDPVDIVSRASIVPDSFSMKWESGSQRPNVIEVEFMDRALNWEMSFDRVEHPSVQEPATFEGYRIESQFMHGVTSRSQARRQARWQLNVLHLLKRTGSFEMGPEALVYEPGDVLRVGHDLLYGSKSGRIDGDGGGTDTIVLDEPIILTDGTGPWEITVRNSTTGEINSNTVDLTVHSGPYPLTIAAGATISMTSDWTFPLTAEDPWVFTKQGEDLLVQVTSVSLSSKLTFRIEWMEYSDDVYDDAPGDTLAELTYSDETPVSERTIPVAPREITARQLPTTVDSPDSQYEVSWRPDDSTARAVQSFEVYCRVFDRPDRDEPFASSLWDLVARVSASVTSTLVRVEASRGQRVQFKVRPVNANGRGFTLRSMPGTEVESTLHELMGTAPSGIRGEMSGDKAIYSVDDCDCEFAASFPVEVRRGGWILGQLAGEIAAGSLHSERTSNWAGGGNVPYLHARRRQRRGNWGAEARALFDGEYADALALGHYVRQDQSWEDYGSGFTGGGDIPNVALSGLTTDTDLEGRTFLKFTGSGLTGTYTTSLGAGLAGKRPRVCYVDAWAEGEQVHPVTLEELDLYTLASTELRQWTLEGPILSDSPQCKLDIQIKTDQMADYEPFYPGTFVMKQANFRLTITRPDDTYDVRVYRFHTRARRSPLDRMNRNLLHRIGERDYLDG